MSVAVNDILKVVASLIWLDGEINQNVFACQVTGGGGPFDDLDVVDDMLDWVENLYANLTTRCSDEIDGSQIQVYKYDAVGDDFDEVGTNAWVFNPSESGQQLPRGVAALTTCQTTDPDVQGKKYIPGLTTSSILDGLWSAAFLVQMLAYAADWITPFVGATAGADYDPGIWSPTEKDIFLAVDSISANGIPAYQRRRKNNVGV